MGRVSDWLTGAGPPPVVVPRQRSRSLVASAKAVDLSADQVKIRPHERWQADAWRMLDQSGELKYATNFMGNAASRVRFFPGVIPEPGQDAVPVLDHVAPAEEGQEPTKPVISEALANAAVQEWDRIVTVEGDKVELFRSLSQKLFVPGEGYVLGRMATTERPEVWMVLSVDEIIQDEKGTGLHVIDRPNTGALGRPRSTSPAADAGEFDIEDGDLLTRVWRPHPQWRGMADSNVRAVLDDLEELVVIGKVIRNAARLRLGGGVFAVPDELSLMSMLPPQEVTFGETDPPVIVIGDSEAEHPDNYDSLDRQIEEQILLPITNPDLPPLPLVLRGPADYLKPDVLRHFAITVDVSPALLTRAEFLLKRVGTGLDIPPEILTGVADVNHWGAWQIERSTYDAHVEPTVLLMASQMASGILRPALSKDFPAEEVARVVVGADPSDLVARPNRGEDAKDAHDRIVISDAALRESLDFNEADAPDEEETTRREARRRVQRPGEQPTNEGPPPDDEPTDDEDEATVASVNLSRVGTSLTPTAAGRSDPGMELVAIDRDLRSRLQVAADAALSRALERAGARVRGKTPEHSAERAAIRGVSATAVPAHLGRPVVAALGLADDELLAGEFEALGPKWDRWVERAQASAVGIAGAVVTLTDAEREELAARQAEDRDAGWLVLLAALLALGRSRLFDPSPTAPPEGEWDDTLAVQPGVLREALATAGGSGRVPLTPGPPGQVATGDRLLAILADHGAVTEGWRWVHGDPARPFPPHLALDGKVVTNWDEPDDDRRSDEAWVPFGMYEPGDHAGCLCAIAPVFGSGGLPSENAA